MSAHTWLPEAGLPVTAETVGPVLRAAAQAGALDLPLPGSGSSFIDNLTLTQRPVVHRTKDVLPTITLN